MSRSRCCWMVPLRNIKFKTCLNLICSTKGKYFCTEASRNKESEWDVVISGGGLVGSAMACALGHKKVLGAKRILLLETAPPLKFTSLSENYSNRVFALTPSTRSLFESFFAWDIITSLRCKEVKRLQVWENCSDAMISFQHPELQSDIAYIVENEVILQALHERKEAIKDNLTVFNNAKVVNVNLPKPGIAEFSKDWVTINLEDGGQLRTKLLIGADGVNSLIRKTMNVKYIKWSYHQNAIVATLKLSEPCENNVAWQRFLPTGPIALLPLTDNLSSLVWTVTPPMSHRLMKMSNEEFVNELNNGLWDDSNKIPIVESALSAVSNILSTFCPAKGTLRQLPPSITDVVEGSRATFPLGLGYATEYVSSRVALIGDAAHRVHPLAGQGVNLGFGDVQCLTEVLSECASAGGDIGSIDSLMKYERSRQKHTVPIVATVEGLHRLYSTDWTPLVLLRSVGLVLTDSINPIKERIISHASS